MSTGLSGGKTAGRDGLAQAIDVVRSGDTLVVTKLDRFARSVIDAAPSPTTLPARA